MKYFYLFLFLFVIIGCTETEAEAEKEKSNVCDTITCSNHGKCIDNSGTPKCICDSNFHTEELECVENTLECDNGIEDGATCRCIDGKWWELDFDTDPTLTNWHLRDGATFDSSELNSGVWKTSDGKPLDTNPDFNFDQSTSIHLKFRNTTIGGKGAVFWINADFTESTKVSIYASLTLQDNDTQTLIIYAKDDNGEVELVKYTDLPTTFIDLWLLLDVQSNEVTIWIDNELKGVYSYPVYNSQTDPFATLLGWGSEAEFDFIRIESCSDGAKHPEIVDTEAPIITLNGDNPMHIALNSNYTEEGATAIDNIDGEIDVTITGSVDTTQVGEYTITYSATDSSNNNTTIERKVFVDEEVTVDCSAEEIRCVGDGQEYTTIQAASNAASNNDTIIIFSGTYYEEVTLSKDLTIQAVENNDVIISGEKDVISWQYDSTKNLYYADSPCGDVQSLFIDGVEKKASRYPNSGYLTFNDINSNAQFSLENFNLNNEQIKDSMAHIRTSHWRLASKRVESFNGGYINLISSIPGTVSRDYKIFFTQVIGSITNNNEWAWNNNKIYIKSDQTPENVTVACNEYGIALSDDARKVEISGLNITKIKGDAIRFTNIESINRRNCDTRDDYKIINNKISYAIGWGISFSNRCEDKGKTEIKNNEISYSRSGGIRMNQVHGLVIEDNYIHDITTSNQDDDVLAKGEYGMCSGIMLQSCGGAHILKNRVDKIGYNGIALINYEKYHGNRIIEKNYVSNAMQGLNDGACIYSHIAGKESHDITERDIIRDNIVENCLGSYVGTIKYPSHQGMGIYLDDNSSQVDVLNNTIIGSAKNLYLHNALDIKLENNHIVNSLEENFLIRNHNESTFHDIYFTNNLIVGEDLLWQYFHHDNSNDIENSDNNIFRGSNEAKMFKVYTPSSSYNFKSFIEWKTLFNFDLNSQSIISNIKPVILINPTLESKTFNNLEGCKKVDNSLFGNSVIIEPYQSVVLFECNNYPAGIYKENN